MKTFADLGLDKDIFGQFVITGSVSKQKLQAWQIQRNSL